MPGMFSFPIESMLTNYRRHGSFRKRTFWCNKSAPATPKKAIFGG
jgi:hypothetical protein